MHEFGYRKYICCLNNMGSIVNSVHSFQCLKFSSVSINMQILDLGICSTQHGRLLTLDCKKLK